MSETPGRPGVSRAVAIAYTVAGFVALVVCGLGVGSLLTDSNVIATRGLGPLPGVVGVGVSAAAVVLVLLGALRERHPSFWAALWCALAAYVGYTGGTGVAVLLTTGDPAVAGAVAGALALGWQGLVVSASAAVAGWVAVALRRTRAQRPRWPWEDEFDE